MTISVSRCRAIPDIVGSVTVRKRQTAEFGRFEPLMKLDKMTADGIETYR
jgi:hypothetical protein